MSISGCFCLHPHCFVCLLSSSRKKSSLLLLSLSLKSAFPNTSLCSLSSPFIPLFLLVYTSGKILLWNQVDLVRNLGSYQLCSWSVYSTSLSFSLFLLFPSPSLYSSFLFLSPLTSFSSSWSQTHHVAEHAIALIVLPPPLLCWDYEITGGYHHI